jgi:hypothetical protein
MSRKYTYGSPHGEAGKLDTKDGEDRNTAVHWNAVIDT